MQARDESNAPLFAEIRGKITILYTDTQGRQRGRQVCKKGRLTLGRNENDILSLWLAMDKVWIQIALRRHLLCFPHATYANFVLNRVRL